MIPPEGVCGPETWRVCRWVYERTAGDAQLASAADWLLGRPLAIVGVVAAGWLARLVIRRLVARGVDRVLARGPVHLPLRAAARPDPRDPIPEREEARRTTRARAVSHAVAGTLSALVWILVLVAVAGILGIDLGPVIAGAGLAGVAVAFGAQSLIKDLLAGVMILLRTTSGSATRSTWGTRSASSRACRCGRPCCGTSTARSGTSATA
jgi:moderate conductance mechanosensitive channel